MVGNLPAHAVTGGVSARICIRGTGVEVICRLHDPASFYPCLPTVSAEEKG